MTYTVTLVWDVGKIDRVKVISAALVRLVGQEKSKKNGGPKPPKGYVQIEFSGDYRKSDNTDCSDWPANARAEMPSCCLVCKDTKLAPSSLMSAKVSLAEPDSSSFT